MSHVVKRSASQAFKSGPSRRGVPLPRFVPPQLSQPVEKPPAGPQWLHEIKLDGYRMAARIDNGYAQPARDSTGPTSTQAPSRRSRT
jgi:ATP-dependent DNA ligase